jgi:hypothetical protein
VTGEAAGVVFARRGWRRGSGFEGMREGESGEGEGAGKRGSRVWGRKRDEGEGQGLGGFGKVSSKAPPPSLLLFFFFLFYFILLIHVSNNRKHIVFNCVSRKGVSAILTQFQLDYPITVRYIRCSSVLFILEYPGQIATPAFNTP